MFAQIDRRVAANLRKVQAAFRDERIGPHHFAGSTGYGHGDLGREALDNVSSCAVSVCSAVGVCGARSIGVSLAAAAEMRAAAARSRAHTHPTHAHTHPTHARARNATGHGAHHGR